MSFFECEFPTTIGYRPIGGPGFNTTVNVGFSGQEQRNRNWALSRAKWTISLITPSDSQFPDKKQKFIDMLSAFFYAVAGKGDGFRLKDHKDFKWDTPQTLGVGNGSQTTFQLTKTYAIGGRSYVRTIYKPVMSTVVDYRGANLRDSVAIALNGTETSAFTLNATTGIVTMNSAPAGGVVVTSPRGEFHYPVRFDSDDLPIQIEESAVLAGDGIISVNALQLIELLGPNF